MMTKKEYIILYEKCMLGNCTAQEQKVLEEYQDDFSLDVVWDEARLGSELEITSRIYAKLQKSKQSLPATRLSWYKLPLTAAVLLITFGIGIFMYSNIEKKSLKPQVQAFNKIVPGSKKAILKLDNGTDIILDDTGNGLVANQGNVVIHKEQNGKLVYGISKETAKTGFEKYNSVIIPRGGEYQLVLPDGTKVWLNAASSIRFPTTFSRNERRVELTGEAYFEVAKNKSLPFRIFANGTEIEVLGTHFNVNSYNQQVRTTLLEGSVRLSNHINQVILRPGQCGVSETGKNIKTETADIESVVGWKNGYFVFHDESIKSIMDKVSRWYDIDVEYRGDVQNKALYGKISRSENITDLLKNLQLTHVIKLKIEGRRVIVMP